MRKILVVDDVEESRYYLEVLMRGHGHEVFAARNGAEALALAQKETVDIIISDILMPVMDGFELCRRCKQDDRLAAIPFIFYTATYVDPRDQAFGLSLGADYYLIKPLEPDFLMQVLHDALSGRDRAPSKLHDISLENDPLYLRQHNEALIRKLETKMIQLENANQRLEQELLERKRAEEALRMSEEKYRRIVETANEGILVADVDFRVKYVNQKLADMLGYLPEEIIGRLLGYFMFPEDLADDQEKRSHRSQGLNETYERRFRRKDGGECWTIISATAIRTEDGGFKGSFAMFTDITVRRQAEEALRRSHHDLELKVHDRTAEIKTYMTKLEKSNEALQEFAVIASHDLQEPLRKVSTFGKMLKQKCDSSLGTEGNDYLERMLNANERMQSLLKGLLDYSRVTLADNPFVRVALSEIIRAVLSDLEVRIEKTGGEVQFGDLPVIQADPTQMQQLFQNLIGNALKFHKEGERPFIKISGGTADGNYCRIVVQDNGIGFEGQYFKKIFAPFQRLHGKSSPYEGTGMGLAICKRIVERHGGSITAKSEPGVGSRFVITLPVTRRGGDLPDETREKLNCCRHG